MKVQKKRKRKRSNKIKNRKIYGKGFGIFGALGNLLSKTRDRRWG